YRTVLRNAEQAQQKQLSACGRPKLSGNFPPNTRILQIVAFEIVCSAVRILDCEAGTAGAVDVFRFEVSRKHVSVSGSTGINWEIPASLMPGPSKETASERRPA